MLYIFQYLYHFFIALFIKPKPYKQYSKIKESDFILYSKTHKKPEWVRNEIIKIKAIDKNLSHRIIAQIFNSKFDGISVGKTFVGYTLRDYDYEVLELRKKFKNKAPYKIKFNQTWGIDLTFLDKKPILGIIEHNSRKVLTLIPIEQKSSISILKILLKVLEHYPKPKFIRTDNENCFKSKLMKFSLFFLGIKHQTTDLNSPWQNGKIERFFGTFKYTISMMKYERGDLDYLCYSFEYWYNNIRFHKNLNYSTPEFVYQENIDEIYTQKE